MDRKAWIVVIACIAALGLWQWAYVQYYAPTPEQLAEQRRAAEQGPVRQQGPQGVDRRLIVHILLLELTQGRGDRRLEPGQPREEAAGARGVHPALWVSPPSRL